MLHHLRNGIIILNVVVSPFRLQYDGFAMHNIISSKANNTVLSNNVAADKEPVPVSIIYKCGLCYR